MTFDALDYRRGSLGNAQFRTSQGIRSTAWLGRAMQNAEAGRRGSMRDALYEAKSLVYEAHHHAKATDDPMTEGVWAAFNLVEGLWLEVKRRDEEAVAAKDAALTAEYGASAMVA